jgi:hypothetical protein
VRNATPDALKGRSSVREGRLQALQRAMLLTLGLVAPALCFGQAADLPGAVSAPATAPPAAVLPGTAPPGSILPVPGLMGAGATGLAPMPTEYTRYGVSAGVGETDNVNLSATQPKAQTLSSANLFFDLIRTGSRLELNAAGNFSDIDYLQNAYSNQVLGRFDGLANLALWKHHLKWLVRDDYGDSQIDVLQATTPTNLQRMNVFSTGPDLTLQPTLSSFIELQGLYSRNSWQSSPFSGNTETGTFTLGRQLSSSSSVSFVGQVEQQRFDNTSVNRNYQVREYYGRYKVKGARTSIDLQGGMDQANDTGSWRSSPLVRLSITRNVSPFSTISLSGGRDYSNAMGSFASIGSGVGSGIPVGAATQTTSNALHTYGNLTWGFQRLRTTLDLLAGYERDSYDVQSNFDVSMADVGLSLGRQLTPNLSANIMATVDRSRYASQGFTQTYGTAGAGLTYRPGPWVVIYGRYDHQFERASGAAQGLTYGENRIFIMIGYYPHSSGTGAPGGMGSGGLM